MIPNLASVAETLDPHPGRVLDQYVRDLRRKADHGASTKGTYLTARLRLRRVATFPTWLESRDRSIETATQTNLEQHLVIDGTVADTLGEELDDWVADRLAELDVGDIHALTTACRKPLPRDSKCVALEKALPNFQNNAQRMQYAHFRDPGIFVRS